MHKAKRKNVVKMSGMALKDADLLKLKKGSKIIGIYIIYFNFKFIAKKTANEEAKKSSEEKKVEEEKC